MSSATRNLLLLTVLIGVATATASITCKRSPNCTCMMNNRQHMDMEFTCNVYDYETETTSIRINGNQNVEIQCSYHIQPTFPPDVHIGDVNAAQVSYCVVSENLTQFLGHVGVGTMQTLSINDAILPETLTSDFLGNLTNVTELSLSANGIKDIAEGAFCHVPRITILGLTRNAITPTATMFRCLGNLMALELPSNGIVEIPEDAFTPLKRLRVLHLWGNRLKTLHAKTFEPLKDLMMLELSSNELEALPRGVFDALVNLRQLNLNHNQIKIAPADLFTANVNLQKVRWDGNDGLQLHESTFTNLPKLEIVSLVGNNFTALPERLFTNSTSIETLTLAGNRLETIPKGLFAGLGKLKKLDLAHNRIELLEEGCFTALTSLDTLYLENNIIENISRELFDAMRELRTLRLDHNRIATLPNFISQRKLRALNASHNAITFEENALGASPLNQCTELEELDLSYNEIGEFEADFMMVLLQLRTLDLSFNRIESVRVQLLERVDTHERRINLSNNNISYVDFDQAELMARMQDNIDVYSSNLYNTVVLLANNPITCNCNAYDLWRYYNDKMDPKVPTLVQLLKEDVRCAATDHLIAEIPPNYFTCDLVDVIGDGFECPQNCTCNWAPYGRAIAFDCADAALATAPPLRFPQQMIRFDTLEVNLSFNKLKRGPGADTEGYVNVTRLLLSHNEIERVEWVPPNVEVLMLDYNNLTRLDYGVMKSLNGSHLKLLTLDHNPWGCSCAALNLSKFVINHLKQIENPNITCNATNIRLIDLSEKELCKTYTVFILSVTITVVCICFLVAVGTALFYRNQQVIKVWLFTHNLLLWWVTEDEVDKDKKYDVFLCFSHRDDDFVHDQLLPQLENGPEKYKVCIHYRDWIAGEFIATQIADSVQNSRRTLIVLSRDFLDSVWGKMEFRVAHKQSMAEGRARVIILVYGDVDLKQDLDEELKAYIKTNTYIKWGDPWFWQRLKYALPHSQKKLNNCQINMQLQQTDLLKSNPITFTTENEKTATTDTGLNPLLN